MENITKSENYKKFDSDQETEFIDKVAEHCIRGFSSIDTRKPFIQFIEEYENKVQGLGKNYQFAALFVPKVTKPVSVMGLEYRIVLDMDEELEKDDLLRRMFHIHMELTRIFEASKKPLISKLSEKDSRIYVTYPSTQRIEKKEDISDNLARIFFDHMKKPQIR
jgi:hypothetical protein